MTLPTCLGFDFGLLSSKSNQVCIIDKKYNEYLLCNTLNSRSMDPQVTARQPAWSLSSPRSLSCKIHPAPSFQTWSPHKVVSQQSLTGTRSLTGRCTTTRRRRASRIYEILFCKTWLLQSIVLKHVVCGNSPRTNHKLWNNCIVSFYWQFCCSFDFCYHGARKKWKKAKWICLLSADTWRAGWYWT